MPDVSRSDSQRSDSSRPRVSFNRDVHVKRISTPGAPRVVGALAGDGEGHLVPLPVRRERPTRLSRRELAKEAERVLAQADSVACTTQSLLDQKSNPNRKFKTLPPLRRKNKKNHNKIHETLNEESPPSSPERRKQSTDTQESPPSSLDRKSAKRGIVASVFSSLDRSTSKKHKHAEEDRHSLRISKNNSSSLNDLTDDRPSKQKVNLKRSVSDASAKKPAKNYKSKKSGVFLSLDRLTARRNKSKNKTLVVHSDHSDRSPVRPRKNILKKSYSDSESAAQDPSQLRQKKQLSPIIEAAPREDYFHEQQSAMLHSSQLPTQKPALTRGHTVDAMVKRLSQDFNRSRGPPRVVTSAPGLITPEHRQHNNNLPFSYTKPSPTAEPTREGGPAAAPTAVDGQVIYAEVVVSGGGGNGGAVSKHTVHTKVPAFEDNAHTVTVRVTEGSDEDEGLGMEHNGYRRGARKEYVVHESSYKLDTSVRGRADGTDSRKKDFLASESYGGGRYDDSFYHHSHNGDLKDDVRRNFLDEYRSDARIIPQDEVDGRGHYTRDILSRSIDSNDLSSRRDRLESRIESQRKDRFLSNKYKTDSLDARNEINRKYTSDVAYNNRRDFLNSQLDYESDRNYGLKTSRYFESSTTTTEHDSYGKKDLFADSGIEVDYRVKDSTIGRKYDKSSSHETKVPTSNHYPTQNVTRVELRTRTSDDEDMEVNDHRTKTTNTFTSTRLVQEQKHAEAIPSSTVLIRHWVPPTKEEVKSKHTQTLKTKSEKTQQALLSDEEYEDYERSRRRDEHRREAVEDYRREAVGDHRREAVGDHRREAVADHRREPVADHRRETVTEHRREAVEEHRREVMEEHRKGDDKDKASEEKAHRNGEKKATKKKQSSAMDKMRQLFTRSDNKSSKKNKKKEEKVKVIIEEDEGDQDPLTSRYTEYRGSDIDLSQESPRPPYRDRSHLRASSTEREQQETPRSPRRSPRIRDHSPKSSHRSMSHHTRASNSELDEGTPRTSHRRLPSDIEEEQEPKSDEFQRPVRQRLATPSPSPSPPRAHSKTSSATLTRINNVKNREQNSNGSSGGSWFKSLDRLTKRSKNKAKDHDKDTDVTTEDEIKTIKQNNNNNNNNNNKNLRFFGDTDQESVHSILKQPNHTTLRRYKSNNNTSSSSNNVGDIPGPARSQRSGVARRAQSREELSSAGGSSRPLQQQTRTVSRSISVLAPWKPRHYREGMEVHYDNNESKTLGRNNGKPPKIPTSHHSTINRSNGGNRYKSKENHTTPQKQRVNKAMSIESLSRKNGSSQGQYRVPIDKKRSGLNSSTSVESLNQKQGRDRGVSSKKHSALNSSAMELNSNKSYRTATKKGSESSAKKSGAKVSRSASMPKDSRLTAGWFKLRNKKQGT
ncbi:zinc finger CCCH domain-containing protein 13 isoform X2 [Periplaneta americana]|uniref:zinc finger CCCH domain-containing protein 13 isoform X2 n=1 Tax=Periplaneta americana TaxID=6978 RepID=UPI0037E757BE